MSGPRRLIIDNMDKRWRPYPLGSNNEVCKAFDKFTVIKIVIKYYPKVQVAETEEQDPVESLAALIGRICLCFRSLVTTKVVKLEIDDDLCISLESYDQALAGCKILKCRSLEFKVIAYRSVSLSAPQTLREFGIPTRSGVQSISLSQRSFQGATSSSFSIPKSWMVSRLLSYSMTRKFPSQR